jgi:SAM-dependent methyltransferase
MRPISYWRSLEFRLVWEHGDFQPSNRVLDIGSPKPFCLYLAGSVGAKVHATDIEPYFVNEYKALRDGRGISPERLQIETADGRSLPYPEGSFDRVYSVSVLEHIPGEGDSDCVREMARVLAPGGICLLTVPFWPEGHDVYRDPRSFYWSASSAGSGDGRVFFQRRYDEEDLVRRLIEPSGLQVERLLYVGERVVTRQRLEVADVLPPITGPIDPVLSRLVHTRPVTDWRGLAKPLCAFIKLVK